MKQKETKQDIVIDSYDYLGKSASTTDYTGLIPSAPQNDYELESYESIYPFRPPHVGGEKGSRAGSHDPSLPKSSAKVTAVSSDR